MRAGMINSVSIKGYRGLKTFDMDGLGRINLIVGRNNSGKSSVLEAVFLLARGGDPDTLGEILLRRGERIESDAPASLNPTDRHELEVSSLFNGHVLTPGAFLEVRARNRESEREIRYAVSEQRTSTALFPVLRSEDDEDRLTLNVSGIPGPALMKVILSSREGLVFSPQGRGKPRRARDAAASPSQYVATDSLSAVDLTRLWNDIVLTPSEDLVTGALRFLEPGVERIAAVSTVQGGVRGGFKVKLRDLAQPVSIGSLGDGTWRLLALAIALVKARGGILLVDEIDTGLHYSVMSDLWRLIEKAAEANDVQVFATTHSSDCVRSLAEVCGGSNEGRASIQRIEAGRPRAVPFSEAEIRVVAEQGIEIR